MASVSYKDYVNFLDNYKNGKKDDFLDAAPKEKTTLSRSLSTSRSSVDTPDFAGSCIPYNTYLANSKNKKFNSVRLRFEEKPVQRSEIFIQIRGESPPTPLNSKMSGFQRQVSERKPPILPKTVFESPPPGNQLQGAPPQPPLPMDQAKNVPEISTGVKLQMKRPQMLPPPPPIPQTHKNLQEEILRAVRKSAPSKKLESDGAPLPPVPQIEKTVVKNPPIPQIVNLTQQEQVLQAVSNPGQALENAPPPPPPLPQNGFKAVRSVPPTLPPPSSVKATGTVSPIVKNNSAKGFTPVEIDRNDPRVKKLVYGTLRGLYGSYHEKANDFVATLPRNMVVKTNGVQSIIDKIASNGDLVKLNGRAIPKSEQD